MKLYLLRRPMCHKRIRILSGRHAGRTGIITHTDDFPSGALDAAIVRFDDDGTEDSVDGATIVTLIDGPNPNAIPEATLDELSAREELP